MKNTFKVLGLAAIIAAIAFNALLITGCPEPEPEGPALVSITVTGPTKIVYTVDDTFDPTGIVVTAFYDDETSKVVTDYTLSGFDSATTGTKTITVTFEGKTATFTVTVNPKSVLYTITGSSGATFTATKGEATVGTTDTITDLIKAIRTDANGEAVNIQFGDGTEVLNVGSASVEFNNTDGTWGAVTLSGKITSSNSTTAISIRDPVSATSSADIATTGGLVASALRSYSTGVVNITGGRITGTNGYAVYNSSTGTINISGGTILTTGSLGETVYINSSGTINITGGEISGGMYSINNYYNGTLNISGGTVSTATGRAVLNNSTGSVTISGGTISATTGRAVHNNSSGKITVSGTAKLTSANTNSEQGTIHQGNSGTGTTVRIEITGGTVENTTADGYAIYNSGSDGWVTVAPGATITGKQKLKP